MVLSISASLYDLVLVSDDRSKLPVLMAFPATIVVFHNNLVRAVTIPWDRKILKDEVISSLVYTLESKSSLWG